MASFENTTIQIGSPVGNALMKILGGDIIPGTAPSYELCKEIYLFHPLGQKMAEAPVAMAQRQQRKITVPSAPDEVVKAFTDEWKALGANKTIRNGHTLKRVYGISSIVMGCKGKPSNEPLEMTELYQLPIFFNVLDPLNTAGSLVLNQIPTASDFNKPAQVTTNGESYHPSRTQVMMNESPVYIAWSNSAFGYVGRSVYQRALFPLKSFIRSMIADDMIQTKVGAIVTKTDSGGSVMDNIMERVIGWKRSLIKRLQTNEVLSIGLEESVETLDMQNVDGAGTYSRTNIIKNAATAADMPAKLLENETMVAGFGEGTEDAKNNALYIEGTREEMDPEYRWFDNITQYRAWSPPFYMRMQRLYPEKFPPEKSFDEAFLEWRAAFKAEWPSLLIEPESEKVKVQETKFKTVMSAVELILSKADPKNQAIALEWLADEISENKTMFTRELELDLVALESFLGEQQDIADEAARNPPGFGGNGEEDGEEQAAKPKVRRLAAM